MILKLYFLPKKINQNYNNLFTATQSTPNMQEISFKRTRIAPGARIKGYFTKKTLNIHKHTSNR